MYTLSFVTFSGMTIPLGDDMNKENNTWEYTDDEAVMVGDDQGYLMVSRTATKRGRRW